jgi:thioredoxin-dependent peroxiredoxin
MIKLGIKASTFSLPDQDGNTVKLSDFIGQWVLVYFYPKDDTPGCTREACGFRDNLPHFKRSKLKILGISIDSVKSHRKFADKYGLPFTLLADEDKTVVNKYGVWVEKSMYGRKYMGTARTSFLIDPAGKIVKIYEKVKPEQHPAEVLADLKTLQ